MVQPGQTVVAWAGISRTLTGKIDLMSSTSGVINCDETTWESDRGELVLRNKRREEVTVSLGDIVGAAWMPPEGGEEGEDKEGCGEDVDGELAETSTGGRRSSGSESEGDCSEGAVKRAGPDDQGGPVASLKEEPVYTSVVSYVPPGAS